MDIKNKYWWEYEKGELYKGVFETIKHLQLKQASKKQANLRNVRLYGNSDILGFRWGEYSSLKSLNRLTLNVVQSAVDTATARIAKTLPKPMFLTEDGDYSMIRKAKSLEQYIGGCFYNMDFYEKAQSSFRDAGILGDGFIKFYKEDGKIKCDRVFGQEIIVDEDECSYGEESQRTMHHYKFVSKQVLKAKYPKQASMIDDAEVGGDDFTASSLVPDLTMVVESWKLPDVKGGKGVHTICVSTCNLFVEDYEQDYFPFEKWGWSPRVMGYWSQGIADQLTGIQIEINRVLKNIQVALYLGAVPKVFVEEGSRVVSSHLDNEIGGIIKYRGVKPSEGQLMRVPRELFEMLTYLYEKAFQIIGLSTMSAQSEKPAGLDSGKALRTFHDIESERFSVTAQRWERFYMRCAKKIIKMSKELAKENKDLAVKVVDRKRMKIIKWADVDMEEDAYVMKVYPTNLLADDPSGRLQDVKELMSMGLINARSASALLDYPDVEGVTSVQNSIVDDIQATIEDIVDNGLYSPPEPFQDLEWAIPFMQSAYIKYKRSSLEVKKLELFVRWIEDALVLVNPPAPPEDDLDLEGDIETQEVLDDEVDEEESFDEISDAMTAEEDQLISEAVNA